MRPDRITNRAEDDVWHEWDPFMRKTALVVGGVCVALGVVRCVTTRRPTPILIQMLVGVIVGGFAAHPVADYFVPGYWARSTSDELKHKAQLVGAAVMVFFGIAAPLLVEAFRRGKTKVVPPD